MGQTAPVKAQTTMRLSALRGLEIGWPDGADDADISGITADSRSVQPGMLFAALAGTRADGARFIADAVTKGASALLVSQSAVIDPAIAVPVLRCADPRRALALVAARFYARQPGHIVAITGTNGKTSVADFTRQLMTAVGVRAASVGTIGVVKPGGSVYGSLTTPDPVTLHQTLDSLAAEGVTHLAMEASSHGLDQCRLDGVRLVAGAFLNLGRDHLDYHPTVEDYLAAKLRLFSDLLQPGQTAVINADGPRAADAMAVAKARGLAVVTTGRAGDTIRLVEIQRDGFRQKLVLEHAGRRYAVDLGLIGDYQASNALVAAALCLATELDPARTFEALPACAHSRPRQYRRCARPRLQDGR
jgi:UDP-N-acetylmuramoyl-L-alanyl-D-glutamate--2,6-diaminopimelate ligase